MGGECSHHCAIPLNCSFAVLCELIAWGFNVKAKNKIHLGEDFDTKQNRLSSFLLHKNSEVFILRCISPRGVSFKYFRNYFTALFIRHKTFVDAKYSVRHFFPDGEFGPSSRAYLTFSYLNCGVSVVTAGKTLIKKKGVFLWKYNIFLIPSK